MPDEDLSNEEASGEDSSNEEIDRQAEIASAKQRPYFWFEDVTFEEWGMIADAMKPTHRMERYLNQPEMLTRILYVREGEEAPEPARPPLSQERLEEVRLARETGGYVGFDDVKGGEVEWILHLMRDFDFDGDCHGGGYSMYFMSRDYEPEDS